MFLCIHFLGQSQNSDLFQLWPDTALAKANSAINVEYMVEQEKQVIYYINLCRMNPSLFEETFLKHYNFIDIFLESFLEHLKPSERKKLVNAKAVTHNFTLDGCHILNFIHYLSFFSMIEKNKPIGFKILFISNVFREVLARCIRGESIER